MNILAVIFGGALGSLCRYLVAGLTNRLMGINFPWGTLAVNLLGCFLVGAVWGFLEQHHLSFNLKLLIFTGFFGGFTTLSAFAIENVNLIREGAIFPALAYIAATNVLGLALVFVGFFLGKLLS
ncbi:MAG: fluoride efflux transporter CrcB [bacterium]